jgi:8-oxo-dGTP pyrophosphatase MutT (NUDIX family)
VKQSDGPRAAGTLIVAESTGRVLLLERSDGEGWSHPGGMSEPGEDPEETAIRELDEETGHLAILTDYITRYRLVRFNDGRILVLDKPWPGSHALPSDLNLAKTALVYDLFVVTVPEEFVPTLDGEHTAWTWADPSDFGPHLHLGAEVALRWLLREYG